VLEPSQSEQSEFEGTPSPRGKTGAPAKRKQKVEAVKTEKKKRRVGDTDSALISIDGLQTRKSAALMPLDEYQTENSALTRNIQRWNNAIGRDGTGLMLRKVVQPTKLVGRVSNFRDLLRTPVVDDRSLYIKDLKLGDSGNWQFFVANANDRGKRKLEYSGPAFTSKVIAKSNAKKVGLKLCEYLSRLPAPMSVASTKGTSAVAHTLHIVVMSDMYPNADWTSKIGVPLYAPHLEVTGARVTVSVPVLILSGDHNDGKPQTMKMQLSVDTFNMDVVIPDVDSRLTRLFPKICDAQALRSAKVPDDKHDRWIKAAMVVRYMQIQMLGAIGSLQDLTRLRDSLRARFLLEKHGASKSGFAKPNQKTGVYGSKKLVKYEPRPTEGVFVLAPSSPLKKDIKGKLPNIRIRTKSATQVAFVINKLVSSFVSGLDALLSWRLAIDCADRVGSGLVSTTDIKLSYCQCTEAERETTGHICQRCLASEVCIHMSRNPSNLLVCRDCTSKTSSTEEMSASPGEWTRKMVSDTLRSDKSIPKDDRKRVFALVWDQLQSFRLSDVEWQDFWANAVRNERTESGRIGRFSPFALSLDGKLPFSIHDGKVQYHANPDNVCLTAAYINLVKGQYFPALLGLIRLSLDLRDVPISHESYGKLIDQLDHFYVKTSRYKFTTKTHRLQFDIDGCAAVIEQMKAPIAGGAEISQCFKQSNMIGAYVGTAAAWSKDQRRDIDRVIGQAELRFGRKICRGPDGAPWLWIKHHMPCDWSWDYLWRLFASRLHRMEYSCNGKWETVDNTVTLLLECAYQHLKQDGKDAFLGLPMTAYIKHTVTFSIGHLHHNEQMRTGFNTAYPQDLDEDHDESLNNISFEARVSNLIKWDYPEEEYKHILEDMKSIHVKTEHYNVPNDCPRLNFDEVSAKTATIKKPTSSADFEVFDDDGDDGEESDNEWSGLASTEGEEASDGEDVDDEEVEE
jgi:hypothetical protein